MDFAHHRQLFLTEQGYSYEIVDESDLAGDPRRRLLTRSDAPWRRLNGRDDPSH